MIDWLTAEIPMSHFPVESGRLVKVGPDGQIEWEARSKVPVEGSYGSNIRIKSLDRDEQGRSMTLEIDGNPSKFLQGHNIFGSDDLVSLAEHTYLKLAQTLEIPINGSDLAQIRAGHFVIRRVDINYMFELETRGDVLAWLRAAEYSSKSRHGRPSIKGGTLYWGKNSRRWAIKAYCKAEEIEVVRHRLPDCLLETPLTEWAQNKLRVELVLRSKELKERNLHTANKLAAYGITKLFNEYIEKIEMSEQIRLTDKKLHELPNNLRSTYTLWVNGHDLRQLMSPATFYRHRKALLAYSIDIAIQRKKVTQDNVVPMIRVLEAEPAKIPAWAYKLGLIHES